jgi:hypothetical protein
MNAYQKATLLLSLIMVPLLVLFMQALNYPGTAIAGLVAVTASAALIYAVRTRPSELKSKVTPRS